MNFQTGRKGELTYFLSVRVEELWYVVVARWSKMRVELSLDSLFQRDRTPVERRSRH